MCDVPFIIPLSSGRKTKGEGIDNSRIGMKSKGDKQDKADS